MKSLTICTRLTVVVTCLLSVWSCIPIGDNNYVNTTYGYRMTGPDGWIKAEAESVGSVSFLAPYDYFVNITTSAEETTDTLQEYWQKEKERLARSSLWVSTAIIQESTTQVSNYNALFIDYTYHMMAQIKAREILLFENGIAYIITYQAEVGHFDEYLNEFGSSLDSFALF